jgi:hypothetical protein
MDIKSLPRKARHRCPRFTKSGARAQQWRASDQRCGVQLAIEAATGLAGVCTDGRPTPPALAATADLGQPPDKATLERAANRHKKRP